MDHVSHEIDPLYMIYTKDSITAIWMIRKQDMDCHQRQIIGINPYTESVETFIHQPPIL